MKYGVKFVQVNAVKVNAEQLGQLWDVGGVVYYTAGTAVGRGWGCVLQCAESANTDVG